MYENRNDVKNYWMQNLAGQQVPNSQLSPGTMQPPMMQNGNNISPAITNQMMQEQNSNPLNSGTLAAMQATKQALGMNEQEKQRALGSAIFSFFTHRAAHPRESKLESISESLNPAMQAYLQEEANVKNQNKMLLDEQRKIEQQKQKDLVQQQRMKEQSDYRNAMLQQRKSEFTGLSAYQQKMLEKGETKNGEGNIYTDQLKTNGMIPEDAVSFNSMKGERAAEIKRINDIASKGNQLQTTLGYLSEMQRISDKFPEMNTKMINVLYEPPEEQKDSNIAQKAIRITKKKALTAIDPEGMAALEEFSKLRSRLLTSEIKTVSGKTATDIFKKLMSEGIASFGHTKEAINYIIKGMKEEILPEYENSLEASKMLSTRHSWPLKIKPLKVYPTKTDKNTSDNQPNVEGSKNINTNLPTYSQQSNYIKKVRSERPQETGDVNDDQIIEMGMKTGDIFK